MTFAEFEKLVHGYNGDLSIVIRISVFDAIHPQDGSEIVEVSNPQVKLAEIRNEVGRMVQAVCIYGDFDINIGRVRANNERTIKLINDIPPINLSRVVPIVHKTPVAAGTNLGTAKRIYPVTAAGVLAKINSIPSIPAAPVKV